MSAGQKPLKPKVLPAKLERTLPKPTVEELQAILDDPDPGEMISCGEHGLLPALRLTDLRANIGGWMDNVTAGKKFAVTRKGKVLALLLPPQFAKPLTMTELEAKLAGEVEEEAVLKKLRKQG